ncbi:RNA polymerase sigma factor [Thalassotalea ponticola]|uniref:RNA polymerase sigma factor n=1 Tax=Thalassotalea ponticola TaxID=1523392 RepID=UPI0025B3CE90|nr:RNA polymerase sigma factor [Thalassotalea ponticola]MDN3651310.1 RNA polymerase sigma factor [Thalassotalea ponticola]
MIKVPSLAWRQHRQSRDNGANADFRPSIWQQLTGKLARLDSMSNEQLLTLFASSTNTAAMHMLVERLHRDLHYFLLCQSDRVLADDISQMTWLTVLQKAGQFTPQGSQSAKAWLFRIARHQLIDELRRQQRWQFDSLDKADGCAASPTIDSNEYDDLQQAFERVLAHLPFAQREAFVLQQEGFSIQQISDICEQNIETIRSRLRYSRNAFKKLLGDHYES